MMSTMKPTRHLVPMVAALLCLFPAKNEAFELIEFEVNVTISDWGVPYTWNYADITGPLNTGFSVQNLQDTSLDIYSTFDPDLGLQIGSEALQDGFVLFDGTLYVDVTQTDAQAGRASIRTTYRMDVRGEWLRDTFVGGLIRAQLGRAEGRAEIGRIEDARLMRFDEATGTWIRAVRAIRARVTPRFMGRARADGVLGHYGYFTQDGSSYVWAVTDTNSKYAVGLAVDRDGDGILNVDDNCPDVANTSQIDTDGDGDGNACDADDDDDGVDDVTDVCPLTPDPGQEDADGDGAGDACDADDDGDGVDDSEDQCLSTAYPAVVDARGCSIGQICPCENEWKNHGAYMRCGAQTSEAFMESGLISEEDKDATVSAAAQSECGAKK